MRTVSSRSVRSSLALAAAIVLPIALAVPNSAQAADAPQHYTGSLADGANWIADVPANYNGTILLYSHGYGPLSAADQPGYAGDALLKQGYALVGSSYSGPTWWALASAVPDQFGSLAAFQHIVGRARHVYAIGESMGGLVSSLENQRNTGQLDGVLTTCGLVAGAVNLNNYQLDGEYALNQLLAPKTGVKLVDFSSPAEASASATELTTIATQHSDTSQGRARIVLAAALLNAPKWVSGNPEPAPRDYTAQQNQQIQLLTGGLFNFIVTARQQIELAAGGNSAFTAGVNYLTRLRDSGYLAEVSAAYRAAGLNLEKDLATLNRNADISPDPGTIARLRATSQVSGHLTVPQLDLHTIADQLVPVQQETWYADRVATVGSGPLLRQTYTDSVSHCNFTSGELVVALHALIHRVRSGHWDGITPTALNAAATAGGYGPTAFTAYRPAALGGARTYPRHR